MNYSLISFACVYGGHEKPAQAVPALELGFLGYWVKYNFMKRLCYIISSSVDAHSYVQYVCTVCMYVHGS